MDKALGIAAFTSCSAIGPGNSISTNEEETGVPNQHTSAHSGRGKFDDRYPLSFIWVWPNGIVKRMLIF